MKAEILLPTVEYGNIKFQVEGTREEIIEEARLCLKAWKGEFGLTPKEFNAFLDQYLNDGSGVLEVYNRMSNDQKAVIQELKKAFKRIKAKDGKEDTHDGEGPGKGEGGDWSGQD